LKLEDPYAYREILTLPKLLLLGTNDRYWAQDALNLYWDGLKGPKWVLYTPNSGHGLEDRMRVFATLSAYMRTIAANKPWPKLKWQHTGPGTDAKLTVTSDVAPLSARVWRVESATTDFRDSKWASTDVPVNGKTVSAPLPAPASGYAASYIELTFNLDGKPFNLSTQLRILPETK
jgi:PhoPQ-activated pathogenicity-related protein